MRFQHLSLAPYGAFASLALDFPRGEADLQVIYGPNEAGKSTLLRAIEGFLYGIPARSSDGFKHGNKDLLIGAKLALPVGGTVGARRRKGNKDTLIPWGDGCVTLVETHLEMLLEQVTDADKYQQLFGLTHAQMTAGSDVLLQTAGDLGISLASAGLGGRIREVEQALRVEYEELFKARGSSQRLPRLLRELEELRGAVEHAAIDGRAWDTARESELSSEEQRAQLTESLRALRAREMDIQLRLNVLPLLQELAELADELAPLHEVPLLPQGFAAERVSVQQDLRNSESQLDRLTSTLTRIGQQLGELPTTFQLLEGDFPVRIEECNNQVVVYRDRMEDLPKREADLAAIEQRLGELRRRLPESLRNSQHAPDVSQQAQVDQLIEKESGLEAMLATAQASLQKAEQEESSAQEALASMGDAPDVSALAEAVRQSDAARELQLQVQQSRQMIGDLRDGWEIPFQRLGMVAEPIETFVTRALPLEASITNFQRQRQSLAEQQRDLEHQRGALREAMTQQESSLASLLRTRRIPSLDELEAARAYREAGWSLVKAVWLSGAERAAAEAAWGNGAPLPEAYEAAVTAADATADDLRAAAEQVEQRRLLEEQLEQKRLSMQSLSERQQQWEFEEEQWRAGWHGLWEPLGMTPGSPEEMLEWRRTAVSIQEKWQQWQRVSEEIREATAEVAKQRELLASAVQSAGGQVREAHGLKDIWSEAERLLKAASDNLTRREERRAQLERARLSREQATEQQRRAKAERKRWQELWDDLLIRLGMAPGESTSGMQAVIRCFAEIATEEKGAHDLRRRIQGIARDLREIESAFNALVADLGQGARTQPVDIQSTALYARLQGERADFAKRQQLLEARNEAEEDRSVAELRRQQATVSLNQLLGLAGVATMEELPVREEASVRRRELESAREEKRRQLQRISEGRSLEELQSLCQDSDLAALRMELDDLSEERDRLETARDEAIQAAESARKDKMYLEGQEGAADLEAREARLCGELREAAGDYLRLRLASALLESGLDVMRQSGDSPVLQRASHWFARLTDGAFSGIALEARGDRQDIRGVRAVEEDRPISPEQMSDGTRDQLFLALRLAIVEDYCQTHEPLPMILDDLLITFDDARTAATLAALAEFSQVTQVLLFTHHRSVCDIAAELGLPSVIEVAISRD